MSPPDTRATPHASHETRIDGSPEPNKPPKDGNHEAQTPSVSVDDPWTRLLTPLLEKDNARCEVWKDEVQNVLIFAGLFSAVVTAFIIESYKSLRRDPVEILLTHLLIKMGDQDPRELSTDALSLPDGAATLINTLWFLSLVLSLVTVVIGTISLQWLREHQRNHVGLEPQVAFSLHQMQVEALDAWFVPEAFTLLCLILQTAVVLFLLGLTALLWILNRTVCTYVAVVVAMTLFFLLSTTVLPTLQALSLFLPRSVGKPRSPCPYKAPQAWVFHCLVSFLVNSFSRVLGGSRRWPKLDARNLLSAHARDCGEGDDPHTFPRATGILFRNRRNDSWLEHGIAWLFQRDSDYMDTNPSAILQKRPIPLYDTVQGLLDMKNSELADLKTVAALDHCIGMVLKTNDADTENGAPVGLRTVYAEFFKRLSTDHSFPFGLPHGMIENVDVEKDFDVLVADAALRLCSRTDGFQRLPSDVGLRALRSCIHITAWMYGRENATPYKAPSVYIPPQALPIEFVANAVENDEVAGKDLEEVRRAVGEILDRFLSRTAVSKSTLGRQDSLDTHDQYVARFLKAAVRILSYNCGCENWDELLEGLKLDRQASNPDFTFQVRPFLYFLILDSGAPLTGILRKSVEEVQNRREEGRGSRNLPLWRFIRWEIMLPPSSPSPSDRSIMVSHPDLCGPSLADGDPYS